MKKGFIILLIVLIVLSIVPIVSTIQAQSSQTYFNLKNIFPTLVPTQIFFWHKKPFFLIDKSYILTASGNIVYLPFNIKSIIPRNDDILLESNCTLYTFSLTTTATPRIFTQGVVHIAPDKSGYAIFHNGYIRIYNTDGTEIYQLDPPITTFSIHKDKLYVIKNNKLMVIEKGHLTNTSTLTHTFFGFLSTTSTVYLVSTEGIATADNCNKIKTYPEPIRYIDSTGQYIFALTKSGVLYRLEKQSWLKIKTFSQISKLMGSFILTPTSSYIVSSSGKVVYYSSWIKAYHIEDIGITNGEVTVKLYPKYFIRLDDQTAITPPQTLVKEDEHCHTASKTNNQIIGCSPSYTAMLTASHVVAIYTPSGNLTATVDIGNLQPAASYAGDIYLIGRFGAYRLSIYNKKIILTIDTNIVNVNGTSQTIDVKPIIIPPGRTFVPLRFISETLGATVVWNEDDRSILITLNRKSIKIWIGKKYIWVNGKREKMDVAPFIDAKAGRTLVPIRFIAEYLGAFIYWVPRTRQVIIVQ